MRKHHMVVSFYEVGRGALAGPVCVGAVALWAPLGSAPRGLADSKALSARSREVLAPLVRSWVGAWAVGSATPREIDRFGILGAQARAADRALKSIVSDTNANLDEAVALVDGNYDWLRRPFAGALGRDFADVVLVVKGDATCASLAGASVLAKVERDSVMAALSLKWGVYGWEQNKGYGTMAHRRAIIEHGVSSQHRASWNLGLG